MIDSKITEEKAFKLLSDREEERQQKHPDFNIRGGGWTEPVCQCEEDNCEYVMVLTGGGSRREDNYNIVQHNEWSWPLIHSIWQLTYT